jgi:hypothetical protein
VPDYITIDDPLVVPGMVLIHDQDPFEDQYFFCTFVKEAMVGRSTPSVANKKPERQKMPVLVFIMMFPYEEE